MATFSIPAFGYSSNNLQGVGSPKTAHSIPMYQPMPAVGTPSFGGLGRSMTPKESSRHSSYSKDIEPTIQTIQPSVERTRRHREYYLEGGDIHFLVENYLFRVHRYFFDRESPVFRKLFADGALDGHHRIGASDNDPLVLHDVKTDDFSRFLWVFYNPIYSIYDTSTEDWAAILGFAHHWQFPEVKALVVRELEKQIIPSIYKIVIYHRYNVERVLLLPSYTDLVSREETVTLEEAKDLGLETSLMIMTAREIVRKGEAPTSATSASPEELRSIIRQVFRFPGLRSDSPLSDITVAEHMDHRSLPHLVETTDLPTVPEYGNEPITLTTSASLNTPPPVTKSTPLAPLTTTPVPPTPIPSILNKQTSSEPVPSAQKKEDVKSASVNPPKEEPLKKEEPIKSTPASKPKDEPKPSVQGSTQPAHGEPFKSESQVQKKPLFERLTDVGKGAGSSTPAKDAATSKDKDGDKSAANKEAKDSKNTTNAKNATGQPDQNGTPVGTPLVNQESDRPGTPSTGQSVSAKKAKTLLAKAGEIKRTRAAQETDPNSTNKAKDKTDPAVAGPGPEPKGPEPGAKQVEAKTSVNGEGKKKVAGREQKDKRKHEEVKDVDVSKGGVKRDGPGDGKKGDVGQDTKKPGRAVDPSSDVTPAVTTDDATKPIADDFKVTPPPTTLSKAGGSEVPSVVVDAAPSLDMQSTTADKKDDVTKEKTVKPKEGIESSKQRVEPLVADEGDVATPRRAAKELPASPAKSPKEKPVPTLDVTIPQSPKDGSDPLSTTTVTGSSGLSPLQMALKDVKGETLMERVARLNIGDAHYQPPKDVVPPAHTDLESDFECETAPSGPGTPRSRAERGSFSLILHSDVPLSDDDDFFLDCGGDVESNASVSNIDGV